MTFVTFWLPCVVGIFSILNPHCRPAQLVTSKLAKDSLASPVPGKAAGPQPSGYWFLIHPLWTRSSFYCPPKILPPVAGHIPSLSAKPSDVALIPSAKFHALFLGLFVLVTCHILHFCRFCSENSTGSLSAWQSTAFLFFFLYWKQFIWYNLELHLPTWQPCDFRVSWSECGQVFFSPLAFLRNELPASSRNPSNSSIRAFIWLQIILFLFVKTIISSCWILLSSV